MLPWDRYVRTTLVNGGRRAINHDGDLATRLPAKGLYKAKDPQFSQIPVAKRLSPVPSRPQLHAEILGALEQRRAGQGDVQITRTPGVERFMRPKILAGNGAAAHGCVDIRIPGGFQAGVKPPTEAGETFRIGEAERHLAGSGRSGSARRRCRCSLARSLRRAGRCTWFAGSRCCGGQWDKRDGRAEHRRWLFAQQFPGRRLRAAGRQIELLVQALHIFFELALSRLVGFCAGEQDLCGTDAAQPVGMQVGGVVGVHLAEECSVRPRNEPSKSMVKRASACTAPPPRRYRVSSPSLMPLITSAGCPGTSATTIVGSGGSHRTTGLGGVQCFAALNPPYANYLDTNQPGPFGKTEAPESDQQASGLRG